VVVGVEVDLRHTVEQAEGEVVRTGRAADDQVVLRVAAAVDLELDLALTGGFRGEARSEHPATQVDGNQVVAVPGLDLDQVGAGDGRVAGDRQVVQPDVAAERAEGADVGAGRAGDGQDVRGRVEHARAGGTVACLERVEAGIKPGLAVLCVGHDGFH